MTTAQMIKQIKILEIIIVCIAVRTLYAKSINTIHDKVSEQKNQRTKRGYSHQAGNDFSSSVQVSSGVLQYSGDSDEHSLHSDAALHIAAHDDSFNSATLGVNHAGGSDFGPSTASIDPWSASGLSPGYEVWLAPTPSEYHQNSAFESSPIHASSINAVHPGSDHITNTVFSDDSTHSAKVQFTNSQLHTKIASSGTGSSIHDQGAAAISDNIDFSGFGDFNTKHYAKSYGK